MPFRITVHLLDPAYRASTLDRSAAEWPPHPYRVFCGLVSVADPVMREGLRDNVEDDVRQACAARLAALKRFPEVPTQP